MTRLAVAVVLALGGCELRPAPREVAKTTETAREAAGSAAAAGSDTAPTPETGSGTAPTPAADKPVTAQPGAGTGSAAGAGSGTAGDTALAASCLQVSEHVVKILIAGAPKESQPQLEQQRAQFVTRTRDSCVRLKWTEEGRKCLAMATDQAGISACEALLRPEGGGS